MKPEKTYEFRDVINPDTVKGVANCIKKVYPSFESQEFQARINPKLAELQFKERANLIAEELYYFLPKDFAKAGRILIDSLGAELDNGAEWAANNVFFYMPHGVYVSWYGLDEAHFELAMEFLYEMTKRFSAEFAIRPFIEKYPQQLLKKLQQWVKDDNVHVRRLVSEGTRPRLPWAPRVTAYDADYSIIIDLLHQLKNDPELYVRRSVANHLNDLTKDRKELVLQTLGKWNQEPTTHVEWITKHALRTLVKAGNQEALSLLGYGAKPAIEVKDFSLSQDKIVLGEKLTFSFEIESKKAATQPLMIDYIVYFQKANGSLSPKVFKLKMIDLKGNETIQIEKKQPFQHLRTRTLYAGKHAIELQINGQSFGKKELDLVF